MKDCSVKFNKAQTLVCFSKFVVQNLKKNLRKKSDDNTTCSERLCSELTSGFFLISNNIQNAIIDSNIHNNSAGGPKMDPIFKKFQKFSIKIFCSY